MANLTRWWHGGAPGLAIGAKIRPASRLAQLPAMYDLVGADMYPSDPTLVYVTRSKTIARAYAAKYLAPDGSMPGGDLYNVRPRGELLIDPDDTENSCTCRAAVIVAAVERSVRYNDWREAQGHMETWDGGGLMYDRAGYAQPSPEMAAQGITAADLRPLGINADFDQIIQFVQPLMRAAGADRMRAPQPRKMF